MKLYDNGVININEAVVTLTMYWGTLWADIAKLINMGKDGY